ncbi:MAG TPA: LptF/LptG family permease [Terriglobia bacterium]|jgi:LPS export ABC transporter permease LptG/LPS export ABC transporter permease LptF|nr:LptF/LptG family permease [Terriglobia bacterium]
MRILTRYVLKEVFSHSLIGLLTFTFVIYIRHIGDLLELVVRRSLDPASILTLFLLPLPGILVLTIPMAVLVGTLIGLSRMAADGEIIAVRAAGISLGPLARAVMLFALTGWALASWMSLLLAPSSARKLNSMEVGLKSSQIPFEIQPRVFIEQFPNLLLYLEDVTGAHSQWRGVFIADTTQRDAPKVTLAKTGILVNEPSTNRLLLHLEEGATHEIDPAHVERYSVISFTETDIPIPLGEAGGVATITRKIPPLLTLRELAHLARSSSPSERRTALVELHYRFALPVASVVLALVGIPLGISTRKGGKPLGLVLTILLVFVYYILMAFGLSFSKQGRLNPALGLWLANLSFGVAGSVMLMHMPRVRSRVQATQDWIEVWVNRLKRKAEGRLHRRGGGTFPARRFGRNILLILDAYILRGWLLYFVLLLITFTGIYMISDFFQRLGDIIRNNIGLGVVLDYYLYLIPKLVHLLLPLSVLMATLVNFGLLTKTNQIIAIRSVGISLYRISAPVFLMAAVLCVGMFVLQDNYLPVTNQRQDAALNKIKGRPAQTYYRPDRQWIFGQSSRIYNYRLFDPEGNVFAHLSVFEFDPKTFQMTRRIYAERAFWEAPIKGWVLVNGWARDLDGDKVKEFMPFSVATFKELTEEPSYFKKEVKPSEQMSSLELRRYINELRQSGFDVVHLSVQLYRKLAYPLMVVVVVFIAVPFSFSTGRRGALSGIAASIGIAIVYFGVSSLFEAMGNLNQLPPAVAAWSPDLLFGFSGIYLLLRVRT